MFAYLVWTFKMVQKAITTVLPTEIRATYVRFWLLQKYALMYAKYANWKKDSICKL
jgi:hypothetical protein